MSVFIHTKQKDYTYDELVKVLNQKDSYYPIHQTSDFFEFVVNFVLAIISNESLVLIDSDATVADLPDIDFNVVNKPQKLLKNFCGTLDDVINAVLGSMSNITLYTSGTTGQPKRVIHTVSTLLRAIRRGEKYQNQIWAYTYNPTHMAGLQVFFQIFINKNTLVDIFNQPREIVYANIEKYQITHISATPTFYRLLLPIEKQYPSVVRITLGGEKSNKSIYESIQNIFPNAKINNVYASTEAGSLFATKNDCFVIPVDIRDKFIVVENELLIHQSLLGQSESFSFDGEYYHSGDLIEWVSEENGMFRFKSRKNELINVGGYKVNPSEVEDLINTIDGVNNSVVYGRSNSILGNIIVAEVQLYEDCTLTDLEIRQKLIGKIQDYKIPRKIKIVETLSLTKTGKLKRL